MSILSTRRGDRRRGRPARPRPEALECRSLLATFTVLNGLDAGPGSLRAAIAEANSIAGESHTIDFAAGVTAVTLTSGRLVISSDVSIVGPDGGVTIARSAAEGTPAFGIFEVTAGATAAMDRLTITGGVAEQGGGIVNAGTLTVTGSTLVGNSARGSGGGIANGGRVTISESTLEGNSARDMLAFQSFGSGGAISNAPSASMEIAHSTLRGNSAPDGGGGIVNSGEMTIDRSSIQENDSSEGAGISNSGMLMISLSSVTDNSATGRTAGRVVGPGLGGGIRNSGTMSIVDSLIRRNSAAGGAAFGGTGSPGGSGSGGGIHNTGVLAVAGSTLEGNEASGGSGWGGPAGPGRGGAIFSGGTLAITNSTISANQVRGGTAAGGGVFSEGELQVIYATLAGNSALALAPGDLDGVPGDGGGIVASGAAALVNTIVAGSVGGDLVGEFAGGNNLIEDGSGAGLIGTISGAPRLGPLADNGGPTPTHALLPGSPALDAATTIEGVDVDQRGVSRPQGAAPDIGAFELEEGFVSPPRVVGLQRLGYHAQPTRLVVSFDAAMDPGRAGDVANYLLVWAGRDGRLGTADDRAIPIDAATYDEALRSVSLSPRWRLPLHGSYRLTVVGTPPGGVASTSGVLLDGAGTGQPGSDFEASFGREVLVRPEAGASTPESSRAERVAEARRRQAEHREAHREQHLRRVAERQAAWEARRAARMGTSATRAPSSIG